MTSATVEMSNNLAHNQLFIPAAGNITNNHNNSHNNNNNNNRFGHDYEYCNALLSGKKLK